MVTLKNPFILALDVSDESLAFDLATQVGERVGAIKLGPRLLMRGIAPRMAALLPNTPLFFDIKLFDIPNTVEASLEAAVEMGAKMVTVHGLGGRSMLQAARRVEQRHSDLLVIPVTILTSWTNQDLTANFQSWSIRQHVSVLLELVADLGFRAVVCSQEEMDLAHGFGLKTVIPGVRLTHANEAGATVNFHDQKRVGDLKQVLQRGGWAVVLGRAVVESPDPVQTVETILCEIAELQRRINGWGIE
ncbi:MAG: orotidine-5'-phosphate decarboxylase [Bdellovibrionaceae bacterium]|nr:orotidine-5'-phosphate decarboxylase [Pseudobdellovibrionaceae bacterium]MDW8189511.1 orotidine-5'-phosphate decarboxylase [Pseudobdellovibrionaceae bacterium]